MDPRDLADAVVERISDENVAVRVYGHIMWTIQRRICRRTGVARKSSRPTTCDGRNDACTSGNHPHSIVVALSDKNVTRGIHGDAERIVQASAGACAAVTTEPCGTIAGHGGNHTRCCVHHPNAMILEVCDKHVPVHVDSDVLWLIE